MLNGSANGSYPKRVRIVIFSSTSTVETPTALTSGALKVTRSVGIIQFAATSSNYSSNSRHFILSSDAASAAQVTPDQSTGGPCLASDSAVMSSTYRTASFRITKDGVSSAQRAIEYAQWQAALVRCYSHRAKATQCSTFALAICPLAVPILAEQV